MKRKKNKDEEYDNKEECNAWEKFILRRLRLGLGHYNPQTSNNRNINFRARKPSITFEKQSDKKHLQLKKDNKGQLCKLY